MKCPTCNKKIIWGGDHDYEDYGMFHDKGIVSNLSCPNDKCSVETIIIHSLCNPKEKKDEETDLAH